MTYQYVEMLISYNTAYISINDLELLIPKSMICGNGDENSTTPQNHHRYHYHNGV